MSLDAELREPMERAAGLVTAILHQDDDAFVPALRAVGADPVAVAALGRLAASFFEDVVHEDGDPLEEWPKYMLRCQQGWDEWPAA